MSASTTTRTPVAVHVAFGLILISAGLAVTEMFLTGSTERTMIGEFIKAPNRVVELIVWVMVAGLALYRNRFGRLTLLIMTIATASVFFLRAPFPMNTSTAALFETSVFVCRFLACMLLFTRAADAWYGRSTLERRPRTSAVRAGYVAGVPILIVITMAFMGALDTVGEDLLIPVTAVALWGAAVVFSIGFLLVPRAGWAAKSTGLLIAIGAPLFARLLSYLLVPLTGLLG